jgi:hypothetical protein
MNEYHLLTLLLCAVLSGCQATTTASVCDGWKKLTPSPKTAAEIIVNDRAFANQVGSHNAFGASRKCWQ